MCDHAPAQLLPRAPSATRFSQTLRLSPSTRVAARGMPRKTQCARSCAVFQIYEAIMVTFGPRFMPCNDASQAVRNGNEGPMRIPGFSTCVEWLSREKLSGKTSLAEAGLHSPAATAAKPMSMGTISRTRGVCTTAHAVGSASSALTTCELRRCPPRTER